MFKNLLGSPTFEDKTFLSLTSVDTITAYRDGNHAPI